ncbi:MAG TPA: glycoside hydrolase family 36 N-terminal domain-containing protein, partial [Actinomycetes bacterium]|nr:glycoside hydrolase family 36 N-terminal domain-containing protein [Actinomycetes bacterium]
MPLLGEHAHGRFTRPHLRGHRRDGSSWSTRFALLGVEENDGRLVVRAVDEAAGLALAYVLESVAGGGLRGRCTVTNTGADEYAVDGLEVVLPLPDDHVELLDLTGRHERERTPQRHPVVDGLWLREGRGGRPGLDAATYVVAGTPGFSTTEGHVVGVHVGWSGNSVLRVERSAAEGATIGGGEHLLPGEVVLPTGASYASPWVYVAAADDGLDGLAAVWHEYQRSLDAHPEHQPVVLNVWEAVFFDHDLDRLR